MGMKDIIQETLPGLEVSNDTNIMLPIDDDDNDKLPYTPIEEITTPLKILNRTDKEAINFAIEARKQLYYELERRAQKNGEIDSFHIAVGDINNFIQTKQAFPEASIYDDEEKKKDPYYAYPRQHSKGISTYTEESVNTGDGYEWLVTRTQTKVYGGEDKVSWKFNNISNPRRK